MSFVDKCTVFIKAGDGGNGIVSWRHEAHVPLGGPAGGDGGNGGNIYFIGDVNETSLDFLANKKKLVANNGGNGGIKNMHGANADHIYIKVPLGTIVKNSVTNKVIADITVDKKKYLIATGGSGGFGNAHFKSNKNKAPTIYERGDKGEEFLAILELKQISNIGLIGLPNAGKSSLLSILTNATPKIGNYPFTTLTPILGVFNGSTSKIILADIPGLIEGAYNGVGLGHDFLRHIERCQILFHVVSMDSIDNPNVIKASETIFSELKKYNNLILNKKIVIIANKIDTHKNNNYEIISKKYCNQYLIFKTSCLTKEGIDELINYLNSLSFDVSEQQETILSNFQHLKNTLDQTLSIDNKIPNYFDIKSDYLKYWVHKIPLNTPDNLVRFNQKIWTPNLKNSLQKLGVTNGDTICIYGVKLTYED